ncbi:MULTISPECIES: DUF29 domain-containing protein [Planktothrix]|jgi:hypothetical protein|uniref:DUF29 domain-containing protein n=1 Tax=Planktothrix rubescens CCAP 1459/22 TaxID=329571 RepID=A0A6J7ZE02_PLARU|nr:MULTISPECIES: DUF29 domain-containing protein [Planktothrix]CAC5341190.1 conserved hypothetical protein [Planktothrix rubescens NIVA-CYA 18]CAD5933149.1 hypothetical protein PCC7821_01416 [Planktothrix rubescens NIVA-CYA 18]
MAIFQPRSETPPFSSLYDQDFYLWLEKTVNLLRTENFLELDRDHLIEELETMGRSEKRVIESNLRVLLMHLLKYQYQPERRSNSWLSTIIEHRIRINKDLKASPSLKGYFEQIFDETYQDARILASVETGLPLGVFSLTCPLTSEQVLDRDFLPES